MYAPQSLPIYAVIYEQDRSYPFGMQYDLKRIIRVVACDMHDMIGPNGKVSERGQAIYNDISAMQAEGRPCYLQFLHREPENPFRVIADMQAMDEAILKDEAIHMGTAKMHTCDWCFEVTTPPDTLVRVNVVHTHIGGQSGDDITHEHEMALCTSCRVKFELKRIEGDQRTAEQREADQAYVDWLETRVAEDG